MDNKYEIPRWQNRSNQALEQELHKHNHKLGQDNQNPSVFWTFKTNPDNIFNTKSHTYIE